MKDRYTHTKNMAKRISFLKFLIVTSDMPETKLTKEQLFKLWDITCENPVDDNDTLILYNFFRKVAADLPMVNL